MKHTVATTHTVELNEREHRALMAMAKVFINYYDDSPRLDLPESLELATRLAAGVVDGI